MHVIHRGILNKKFKENCLNSFKASFKKKYPVETDIHITKDQKFICYHDFTLKRLFKVNKSIKNSRYEDLKKITEKKIKMPLLTDLLKASKNKYPILIEIKPLFKKKTLMKLINETKKYKKCIFISFKEKNVYNLLKIKSNLNLGLSFSNTANIGEIIKKSESNKIKYLVLDKKFINSKKIHKIKKEKFFYTIKKKQEYRKYSKSNNLIFENL